MKHKEYKAKVIDKQIKLLHDKGIWVKSKNNIQEVDVWWRAGCTFCIRPN